MNIKDFIKDQRGSTPLLGIFITFIVIMLLMLVTDALYVGQAYYYIKTQMDTSNKAVYREIDAVRLAKREFYIDETAGQQTFFEYLKKNLNLDNALMPTSDSKVRITEPVTVIGFEIYNQSELPAITPVGTNIDNVSVHSQIEVKIRPIFWFMDVTIRPYMDTDLPDKLLVNYHP